MATVAQCDSCGRISSLDPRTPLPGGWFAVEPGLDPQTLEVAFRTGMPLPPGAGGYMERKTFCSVVCVQTWTMLSGAGEGVA